MTSDELAGRLAALPNLESIPRSELAWLAEHGRVRSLAVGEVVAPKGRRIETLWILLSGRIGVWVDRGAGPRRVITWQAGEVSGILPYSRMSGPPGDNSAEEATELLTVHEALFPEMILQCPTFTAYTVHLMLDRTRSFNASDLQDEKMVSLGKLAAGLAHELNNPASAAVRSAKVLGPTLDSIDAAAHALRGFGLHEDVFTFIEQIQHMCHAGAGAHALSVLEASDREEAVMGWLDDHGADATHAPSLVRAGITIDVLDRLAESTPAAALHAAVEWIAGGCEARSMATTIEQATTRIYDLVAAVKRFTYMDHVPASEVVDIAGGLRDTLQILSSKAQSKRAVMTLDVDASLAPVRAAGSELNQVWMNLVDNALDAVDVGGHISVTAQQAGDRVNVCVVDDGPGIAPEIRPFIFDPFFTTKPPGQGTGLGLDISRRLLRRHHGDISVDSKPGRTAFCVSLLAETGR